MFIQSLKYDYQTGGILVEYVTKAEARKMSDMLSRSIFGKGELEQFDGLVTGITSVENYLVVGTDAGADEMDQIIEFIKDEADPDQYDEDDYEQKGTNESHDVPSPFEDYIGEVSGEMSIYFDEVGMRNRFRDKYYDALDNAKVRKELLHFFKDGVSEEDAAVKIIKIIDEVALNEDFSMGVEGPTGLNQGIPHGGPGKGVLPKTLYNQKAETEESKEEKDDDTEENLKKLRDAKKLLKNEGYVLEREVPEYFCRNLFTLEDLENYLHDDDGFSWDEVDCLIDHNREMISSMLEQGKSPEEVSADLDDSCLKDLEV